MSRTIRISDESEKAINQLGGVFDSPDDIIQKLIREAGYGDLLRSTVDDSRTTPVIIHDELQTNVDEGENPSLLVPKIEGYSTTVVWSTGEEIKLGTFRKQIDAMEGVVNHLIDECDLLNRISFPYVPSGSAASESEQALMNTQPIHPDGQEMKGYRKLIHGTYLHTGYDREHRKAHLNTLASECGVSLLFEGDW